MGAGQDSASFYVPVLMKDGITRRTKEYSSSEMIFPAVRGAAPRSFFEQETFTKARTTSRKISSLYAGRLPDCFGQPPRFQRSREKAGLETGKRYFTFEHESSL
ncbi:hypothetical protein HMPREF3213_03979 [Heyndrickxia coagulans]|jgi:hypothetical protein|uniref:Uncharacterized protein n=1 Tax=Heyndrickxia coagulans TaxID=1398 RepID=A0A133K9G6_HEYCO|nr:hypothetical protein HMPREF3213_03979 [Heyndrickxia coagulans]